MKSIIYSLTIFLQIFWWGCSKSSDHKANRQFNNFVELNSVERKLINVELDSVERNIINIDSTINIYDKIAYKYCKNNIIYKKLNESEPAGLFEKRIGDKYNYYTLWDKRNYSLYNVKNRILNKYDLYFYEFYFLEGNEAPAYERIDSNLHLTENIAKYFDTSWCNIAIGKDSTVYKLQGFQQNDFGIIISKHLIGLEKAERTRDSLLLLSLFNMHDRKIINEYENN